VSRIAWRLNAGSPRDSPSTGEPRGRGPGSPPYTITDSSPLRGRDTGGAPAGSSGIGSGGAGPATDTASGRSSSRTVRTPGGRSGRSASVVTTAVAAESSSTSAVSRGEYCGFNITSRAPARIRPYATAGKAGMFGNRNPTLWPPIPIRSAAAARLSASPSSSAYRRCTPDERTAGRLPYRDADRRSGSDVSGMDR
jgi:hypothetical protein